MYAGEILEHFTKEDGFEFLEILNKVGKNILISTPVVVSNQKEVFGNSYETHRSSWVEDDFVNVIEYKRFGNLLLVLIKNG